MAAMGWFVRSGLRSRAAGTVGCVVALLAARNLAEVVLPDAAYVPTNVAVATMLLALAQRSGCSWDDLGLDRRHVRRGLSVGSAVASVAITGMLVGAALATTRGSLTTNESQ